MSRDTLEVRPVIAGAVNEAPSGPAAAAAIPACDAMLRNLRRLIAVMDSALDVVTIASGIKSHRGGRGNAGRTAAQYAYGSVESR